MALTEKMAPNDCVKLEEDTLKSAVTMIGIMKEVYEDPEDYCIAVNNFLSSLMFNAVVAAGGVDVESMTDCEKRAVKGGMHMVYANCMRAVDSFKIRDKSQEH